MKYGDIMYQIPRNIRDINQDSFAGLPLVRKVKILKEPESEYVITVKADRWQTAKREEIVHVLRLFKSEAEATDAVRNYVKKKYEEAIEVIDQYEGIKDQYEMALDIADDCEMIFQNLKELFQGEEERGLKP